MDKKELHRLIWTEEQRIEKERPKRAVKAILIFSAVYFVLFCIIFASNDLDILGLALLALISGVAHLFLSTPVFHWLFTTSQAEDKYINEIKKKLNE